MKTFSDFLNEAALRSDLQKVKDQLVDWLESQDVRLGKGDIQNGVFGDFFRITIEKDFEYTFNGKEIKVIDLKKDKEILVKQTNTREAQSVMADLIKKYSKI